MTHLMEENDKYRETSINLDYLILLSPQQSDRFMCVFHAQFLFFLDIFLICEYLHLDLHTGTLCVPGACGAR